MLYDPKWEQQTKADPLSLDSLIAWLELQPADTAYRWSDMRECMLGQWLASLYCKVEPMGSPTTAYAYELDGNCSDLCHFDDIASMEPHTFGAALKRAYEMRHFGHVLPGF